MDNMNCKIAIPSNNGRRVSGHFGPTKQYVVITVKDGKEVNRETREKFSHHQGSHDEGEMHRMHQHKHSDDSHSHGRGEGHSHGAGSGSGHGHHHHNHNQMIVNILDCDYMTVGGMGNPVYQACEEAGIKPILTDLKDIDEVVKAIVDGSIVNRTEQLH